MLRKLLHVLPLLFFLSSPCWAQTAGWEFPTAATVSVGSADNGKILGSDNTPGTFVTVNLANPSGLATGWEMGFSTAGGHGIVVNPPNGVYIFAGQKQLTSYSAPSNTNYEYFSLQSDGTNYRLLSSTATTVLYNGLIGSPAGKLWNYLFSYGYTASGADNGTTITSALTGAATTITLPSTGLIPNGWSVGLYAAGNSITLNLNGVSGGTLITPNGTSVTSYTIPGTPYNYALVSFDGSSFRILTLSGGLSSLSIDTIAQLKGLLNTQNGTTVTTRGYYTAGDRGGNQFTFNTTNCTLNSGAGDGGSQIPPNIGGGCFNLSTPAGGVLPQMFGAKGDGSTDDTVAIQNAINYGFTNNIPVLFQGGPFNYTSLIIYGSSSSSGAGSHLIFSNGACLDKTSASAAGIVTVNSIGQTFPTSSVYNIHLENPCLNGEATNGTNIALESTVNALITDPVFTNIASTGTFKLTTSGGTNSFPNSNEMLLATAAGGAFRTTQIGGRVEGVWSDSGSGCTATSGVNLWIGRDSSGSPLSNFNTFIGERMFCGTIGIQVVEGNDNHFLSIDTSHSGTSAEQYEIGGAGIGVSRTDIEWPYFESGTIGMNITSDSSDTRVNQPASATGTTTPLSDSGARTRWDQDGVFTYLGNAAYIQTFQNLLTNNPPTTPAINMTHSYVLDGIDGFAAQIAVQTYGALAQVDCLRHDGTHAAPTTVVAGDVLCEVGGIGQNNTAANNYSNTTAAVDFVADDNFSTSATGSHIDFYTTPLGTTTRTKEWTIGNAGGLYASSLTPSVQGAINVKGLQINNANLAGTAPSAETTSWAISGATTGQLFLVDTRSGAVTATLPSSPSNGDEYEFSDAGGAFGTNNFTIAGNGKQVLGGTTTVLGTSYETLHLRFYGTIGWWIAVP